jgi:sugar lactone lactonase YvrE
VSVRRIGSIILTILILAAAAWAGRWWWRATHPLVPAETPPGWVPVVVVAAGHRTPLSEPFGIALAPDGAIYISDGGDAPAIRRLRPEGDVQTIAGGGRGFADGKGSAAAFDTPSHLALGPDGAIYVADTGNHAIRRVTPEGAVSTIAGDGTPGTGDGPGARLNGPVGVAVGLGGRVLVADTYNDRVVVLSPTRPTSPSRASDVWTLTTVAGSDTPGFVDGIGTSAYFDTPAGVAALPDGSVIVADTGNDTLRRIALDGTVVTLPSVDLTGTSDMLWRPIGVAADSRGRLYVTDAGARVVEVRADGGRRVLTGARPGFANGLGTSARMREPSGIAVAANGRVVVADSLNGLVRVLDIPERLGPWTPTPPCLPSHFDLTRFARVPLVWPVEPQEGPHEVAGTLGEPRGNAGGDGRERFHAGVDVRADDGVSVRAVRDGVVSLVLPTGSVGALSEFLTVGPLTYMHIRVGRDRADAPTSNWATVLADPTSGKPARVRVRRGTHVAAGDLLGSVNRFRHVHLNIGPPGEEGNALRVGLAGLVDTVPPVIAPAGITLTDRGGHPLTERVRNRLLVTGPVRIVVEAYDRMDDSPPRRRLGVYRVGYQVLRPNGTPTPPFVKPHIAITFDRLPPDPDAPPSLYALGSGIPFYGTRMTRYLYIATSRVDQGSVVEALWEPRLPPGDYVLRVLAEDAFGNAAIAGRDLPIAVELSR